MVDRIRELREAIEAEGWTVEFREFIENARQPGLLGMYAGIADRSLERVLIRTKARTDREIADTMEHELRHVQDPEWDCGNRDVFGRGGPALKVEP